MDYRKIIKNKELRLTLINLLRFIPDKQYLQFVYWIKTGHRLNLNQPIGFNEKQQWLKLYARHPEYTILVDKFKVRDVVAQKIGEEHLIPLLGHWNHYKDIDFNLLPDTFVLKCNHDSGSVKIVTDKSLIDHKIFERFYEKHLSRNPFYAGREFPYKNVQPQIIAEKLMVGKNGKGIADYKFFCFNGVPKLMFVATERETGEPKFDFYDMGYNHLPIFNIHENAVVEPEKTTKFEEMKKLAAILSENIQFVRIDFYEINEVVYFGEYTFYHGGGFWLFKPDNIEKILGDYIELPVTNSNTDE